MNTRRLVPVILAAFFSTTGILLILVLCLIVYDTAGIEEDEEEARAALPFHYIPNHHLIPEPSLMLLPKARTRVAILGAALAAVTTAITTTLLTLVYSREVRTFLTRLGVLPPIRHFQRYVRTEPGPRLGCPSPTEPESTPLATRNACREHHWPQSILLIDERNIRAEDEPDMGQWVREAIATLLQPMDDPPFRDLHPGFELPNAPAELNPVPSYEVRDPRELPRACPRPLQLGEHNSVPFPMTTEPQMEHPFIFSFGARLPQDTDSDSSDEPGPSQ
ncbi:hypothetical protein ARMGADRAFT_1074643 [Armillaria gallica]|uniref:Uncharacterized protein n=1 Tax=Armillaria gallica TaxID=47427 RepID=A0A2H3E0X1_ARMGA|nr:hypothetical protein ARMGADRAFT_1074643 [Armillaria gallica]